MREALAIAICRAALPPPNQDEAEAILLMLAEFRQSRTPNLEFLYRVQSHNSSQTSAQAPLPYEKALLEMIESITLERIDFIHYYGRF